MEVKVFCNCGAKFKFETQPVRGRLAAPVNCPVCGADATELANKVIAEKIAAAPAPVAIAVTPLAPAPTAAMPAPATPTIGVTAITPPPPGTAPSMRVAGLAHAAPPPPPASESSDAPAAPSTVARCQKHSELAAADCFVCGKPICPKCMEQFGYLCSAYCKGQAQARKMKVPVYEGQMFEKQKAEGRSHGLLIGATIAAVALLFGAYVWYWFIGSRPKQAFRIETAPSAPFLHADWIGDDRFFAVTPARAALFNSKNGSEIWAFDLPKNEIKTYSSKGEERGDTDWNLDFDPVVKLVSKDIWIGLPSRVIRLDGQTGKKKQEIMIAQRASDYSVSETHLLAVSRNPTNDSKLLTRISFADGRADAQYTPASSGSQKLIGTVKPMQGLGNTSLKNIAQDDEDFLEFNSISFGHDPDFVFTGPNVAHVTRKLLEARIETQETSKKKAGPLLIDSGNVRASQGIEAAEEFFNQNAPDEKIDQSLYQVTIDRFFGNAPQWSGQVTGRPYFFTQKTVDLLVAGPKLIVFNKNNQKLWEAKLTYTIGGSAEMSEEGPALEVGNRLLFYDQGVLTAYDLKKGEVQWRVNSVGISGLSVDSNGNVYLNSTTAGPESIRYSGQVNFSEKVRPMIVKVELRSGKVLWQVAGIGDECIVSGDYVYTADTQISGLDMMKSAVGGGRVPTHWRLHRLNPSNGKEKWEYYREGAPVAVRPKGKQLLFQFKKDLRLLRYL
jgi:hypothetical protein